MTQELSLSLRIDWSEIDTYYHVNNVSYMKYMQSARVAFWELSGLYEMHLKENRGAILVSAKCDYKHPLFFPGNVHIKSFIIKIGTTSFGFEHHFYNDKDTLCAIGQDIAVCFDFNTNKKFQIPIELRALLERYKKK